MNPSGFVDFLRDQGTQGEHRHSSWHSRLPNLSDGCAAVPTLNAGVHAVIRGGFQAHYRRHRNAHPQNLRLVLPQ